MECPQCKKPLPEGVTACERCASAPPAEPRPSIHGEVGVEDQSGGLAAGVNAPHNQYLAPVTIHHYGTGQSKTAPDALDAPRGLLLPSPNHVFTGRKRELEHLPTGTVTFVFTDIEGSTRLWEQYPEPMRIALARHDAIASLVIKQYNGRLIKERGEGDSLFCVFARATDAVAAVCALQQAFVSEPWSSETPIKVRMALHTDEYDDQRDDGYYGPGVNRCARLRAIGHGEQILVSGTTNALASTRLPEGVSLLSMGEHRLRDLSQAETVFQLQHPALPSQFPPLLSLGNPDLPNNLPQQVTSFIGRVKEIIEVKSLLGKTRLLTLTGSGGSGKTRLGLQVAAEVLENYSDGVWLAEFAALSDASLVPQTVATAMGLRENPGRPIHQTLADYLKAKHLLLVFDNCEHLIQACAQMADGLLKACPHLTILSTSREGLNVSGERLYRVPSLSLPDFKTPSLESLNQSEAAHLFMERAQLVKPDFAVTDQNASPLAQICHQLDGIPLAIELAAARVRSLSVEDINTRLDQRFRLLTGGSRTALPRHRTLHALIDWSYDLLNAQEKTLFCHLSVFAGGWTLEAAEAVCIGNNVEDGEVLDLLTSLADKSLVVPEQDRGHSRYRLLEITRQYARNRLDEREESETVRERHQAFVVAFAEQAEPQLLGPEQAAWLHRLEREHDNLRTALEWSNKEAALRIAGSLWRFWDLRGYFSEGQEWLTSILAATKAHEHAFARAKALRVAGIMTRSQGNYSVAHTLLQDCLALYQDLGDKQGIAHSLNDLGRVAYHQGDSVTAHKLYRQSLTIWRELDDKQGIAASIEGLGNVALSQGDVAVAHSLYEESLAIQRELGDKRGIAAVLSGLGNVALSQSDYSMGRMLFEKSLAIQRELENKGGIAWLLQNLGRIAHHQSNLASARTLYAESLTLLRELKDKGGIAESLEAFATLASEQEQAERTLRLWGAIEALREAIDSPLPPANLPDYERQIAQARASLGNDAFAAAWEQGRNMTMEQAIEFALKDADM